MTTATVTAKPAKQQKPLPAPNSDFYEVYETLSAEELATVKKVRARFSSAGQGTGCGRFGVQFNAHN
jgi:hypothetical protein